MWSAEKTREAARLRGERDAEREKELAMRRTEARQHGEELARSIAERDKGVVRIIGFGSAFDERLPFRFSSDIDLAVMGGTIIGWKITEQSPWKVDYVELEDQEQSMVDAITAAGVVLYERS
ncbi:MAG: hypothetical protein WD492_11790 [Alkalispirochaeta sp.]